MAGPLTSMSIRVKLMTRNRGTEQGKQSRVDGKRRHRMHAMRCFIIHYSGIPDKKYPSKCAGVWYLQTSRHQSACCAAKLVMSQATRAVFICMTLFIASTTSPSTQ
ncbi:hypothetical protein C1N58_06340 [Pantoea sp. SGAir0180]